MKRILMLLITVVVVNCCDSMVDKEKLYFLKFKDSLVSDVVKTSVHGKSLILNDSIVLYKTSKLVYEDYNPKWLFDKTKNKKLVRNEYVYSPDISEVEAPYKLIKSKKSNYIEVVKDTDTLWFSFEAFDEIDFY